MSDEEFGWLDPGTLRDDELWLQLVAQTPAQPEKGCVPSYNFAMRVIDHLDAVGHVNLRIGDSEHLREHAGHVGFSVIPEFRGRRFAARGTQLVLDLARRHGMTTIWITCNPDNAASARSIEIVGGTYVETVDVPPGTEMYDRGEHRKRRYRLEIA